MSATTSWQWLVCRIECNMSARQFTETIRQVDIHLWIIHSRSRRHPLTNPGTANGKIEVLHYCGRTGTTREASEAQRTLQRIKYMLKRSGSSFASSDSMKRVSAILVAVFVLPMLGCGPAYRVRTTTPDAVRLEQLWTEPVNLSSNGRGTKIRSSPAAHFAV